MVYFVSSTLSYLLDIIQLIMVLSRSQTVEIEEIIVQAFQKKVILEQISFAITSMVEKQLKEIISKYEEKINVLNTEVVDLKRENREMKMEYTKKVDELEQYSRRNNIRLFGVEEKDGKDVVALVKDVLSQQMGISIATTDTDRCHRTGKKPASSKNARGNGDDFNISKSRGILIKFRGYMIKEEILRARRKLRGSMYSVAEDLTHNRLNCMKSLKNEYGKMNVWSIDGALFYKDKTGKRNRFTF